MDQIFHVGDYVIKNTGDYLFAGIVVAAFRKLPRGDELGPYRYAVENKDGILHIFGARQLQLRVNNIANQPNWEEILTIEGD